MSALNPIIMHAAWHRAFAPPAGRTWRFKAWQRATEGESGGCTWVQCTSHRFWLVSPCAHMQNYKRCGSNA
eukprot:544481-Pelagomonas_calceolata.AAC.2